mmetsp:Transcript_25573/g.73945  ORF Transcript_25573/g.73945 Transcript_25573/m.73945 type:complete len:240 (+) Transcript_25573:1794-2513(+)
MLLEVRKGLDRHGDWGPSAGNATNVVGGGNGRATAIIDQGNSRPLNLTNGTILGNTNVRTVNKEAASVIGNVSRHSAESSITCEREARQTTKVEVAPIDVHQLLLEVASQLIAAQRGAQKGVLGSVALGREGLDGSSLQLGVRDGTGESSLDHGVKASRRGRSRGLLRFGSLSGRFRGLLHGLGGWGCRYRRLLVLSTDSGNGADRREDVFIVHDRGLAADGAGGQSTRSRRRGEARDG